MNGKAVDGADTIVGMVRGLKPGDKVAVTYVRDGTTRSATVALAEKTG
jgi:hypothetical protein